MNYKISELPTIDTIKKIFFVGIKGVGTAPLAIIAKEAGFEVGGSDSADIFITDKYLQEKGIAISVGFETDSIESFFAGTPTGESLIVTTGAHGGFDNPQGVWGKGKSIPVLTQGQALAIYMEGDILGKENFRGISIAGSHGKTTITSLLATTMKALGLDPSYSIGTGEVYPLGAPGHLGGGEYFIVEADEYASEPLHDRVPKFLYQQPTHAVFNNIDFDHPDIFESIEDVAGAFEEFAHNIKSGGRLFINGDDRYLSLLKDKVEKDIHIITYGMNPGNSYQAVKVVFHPTSMKFTVLHNGVDLGVFDLMIHGEHNVSNAMAVISLLSELGYDAKKIKLCLTAFEGSKRRAEKVGVMESGAIVIDDYGHHPLEIKTTLLSVKKANPGKKIICIFQPHTYSRTKALLPEFSNSFECVEKLILLPVFKSARDTEKDLISNEEVVSAHKAKVDTIFIEKFSDVVEYVQSNYASDDFVVVTMGAGNVYEIAHQLIKK